MEANRAVNDSCFSCWWSAQPPSRTTVPEEQGGLQRMVQAILPVFARLSAAFALQQLLLGAGLLSFSVVLLHIAVGAALLLLTARLIVALWDSHGARLASGSLLVDGANHLGSFALINWINLAGLGSWIHEMGHATAAHLLYHRPAAVIELIPFIGGATSYTRYWGLTRLGEAFGSYGTNLVIGAAGTGCSLLVAMGELAFAAYQRESHPQLADWATYHGLSLLLNELLYGFSAFGTSLAASPGHDFLFLYEMGGIHPAVAISLLIALPSLELLALWLTRCEGIELPVA